MTIKHCPLCNSNDHFSYPLTTQAPKSHLFPPGRDLTATDFALITITHCKNCNHVYNKDFINTEAESIYTETQITNSPVSPGMNKAVNHLAEEILAINPNSINLLEIGGGSGALSMAMAQLGLKVTMLEPNKNLDPSFFSAHGVLFINSMFPTINFLGLYDLVVCRQVLEHTTDPEAFISALLDSMNDNSILYLEVPNSEFIFNHKSYIDFHYPHIHYFSENTLLPWLRKNGLDTIKTVFRHDGHDIGFFLKKNSSPIIDSKVVSNDISVEDFFSEFSNIEVSTREKIMGHKNISLYGATAYSQAFLGIWPTLNIKNIFDDTKSYWGSFAYAFKRLIPVSECTSESLDGCDAVIITAYLHDITIYSKLVSLGFKGKIYTLRPKAINSNILQIESLF
jgi:hypothetical protein